MNDIVSESAIDDIGENSITLLFMIAVCVGIGSHRWRHDGSAS